MESLTTLNNLPRSSQNHTTVLLAAFEGWNDAGGAASEALQYLTRVWDFTEQTGFNDDEYFIYTQQRPLMMSQPDGPAEIHWPELSVSETTLPDQNIRLIVLTGPEPAQRWKTFIDEFYALAQRLDVDTVLFLGALMAETPHTRPFPVEVTSESPLLRQLPLVERTTYTGPTGITGVTALAAPDNLPAASLWVSVPHYVGHPPHPKATLALLRSLETLLGIAIPLRPFEDEMDAWERGAAELLEEESELADYVRQLESIYDAENPTTPSGEDIAAEFEQFLKRREQ
ncbi:PAC2 family protein [Rothia sp. ZJ932]|uniref:PAC2 family protein n=1 Tax=Rothia sp. ZJ932 TaxID=2810516 RepID=UPI0019678269|nr:PAC2 family protein [Rothia sp. ZJ932]QRZ60757.1 PAC2 family protein [Rothia sp. ZJ932]